MRAVGLEGDWIVLTMSDRSVLDLIKYINIKSAIKP